MPRVARYPGFVMSAAWLGELSIGFVFEYGTRGFPGVLGGYPPGDQHGVLLLPSWL